MKKEFYILAISPIILILLQANLGCIWITVNAALPPKPLTSSSLSAKEVIPPTRSEASGIANMEMFTYYPEIVFSLDVKNISNVTKVHIHLGNQSQNGPVALTLYDGSYGTPSGKIYGTLASGFIDSKNLTGPLHGKSLDELVKAIEEGRTYIDIHTLENSDGDIRGNFLAQSLNHFLTSYNYSDYEEGTKVYNLINMQKSYPVHFLIVGAHNKLDNITVTGENNVSSVLRLKVTSQSEGKIIIALPRAVIDSKDIFGRDDTFDLSYGKHFSVLNQIGNDTKWRAFEFDFPKGTEIIQISPPNSSINLSYRKGPK